MARNHASAKKAGSGFERMMADWLRDKWDDHIDKRPRTGAKDKGDIGGFRFLGQRIVVECKNTVKLALGTWANEAEVERVNDNAGVAMIFHKRHGKGKPEDQWVTMTAGDLLALIKGKRD